MRRAIGILVTVTLLAPLFQFATPAQDAKADLQGVWVGHTMEVDGKALPVAAAMRMRFDFKEGKLYMKGNFRDDRVEECAYKIDPTQLPKHLEFTPPKQDKAVLGIYEVTKGELKVCLRHAGKPGGRPTEFKTTGGEGLILLVLKKQ